MNPRRAILNYSKALNLFLDQQTDAIFLPSMPASAEAFTILSLSEATLTPILWLHATGDALPQAHQDLLALGGKKAPPIIYFPAREALYNSQSEEDLEIAGLRQSALFHMLEQADKARPTVIIASIQSVMQPVPEPGAMSRATVSAAVDGILNLKALSQQLVELEYDFVPEVVQKGQAARRGGLIDIWPATTPWPIRIELFGDSVESIRLFDPATQRSIQPCPTITIPSAHEWQSHESRGTPQSAASLIDYLKEATVVWSEPGNIQAQAENYAALHTGSETTPELYSVDKIRSIVANRPQMRQIFISPDQPVPHSETLPRFETLPNSIPTKRIAQSLDHTEKARNTLVGNLAEYAKRRFSVSIYFDTDGSLEHFDETYPYYSRQFNYDHNGSLSEGFISEKLHLIVVSESDLYGRRTSLTRHYDPYYGSGVSTPRKGSRISDFSDIDEGDLVVHADHGIGRYLGIRTILFNGRKQEVLAIEYADNGKLYVPMSHAHLLSRYIGLSSRQASLHKLGGKRWSNDKQAAQQAVFDFAAELLEIQAARNLLEGHAFPSDTSAQREFEASFPFIETDDQRRVISSVKSDMESTRPMDRLICGDAGYGKTEVAMRAAFKAVQDGRQVAMLVPTTILAQQHYRTFIDRMAGFPVRIGVISRFCTRADRTRILKELREGKLDIIIGTHALVQDKVSFSDLGLVIIDEEQRFGVRHKEHLKQIKRLVDVLTLSATPIPRTLYLSMTGARDMSLLQTPPRERMAIETIVASADDSVIRDAIIRELGRNGQVYYLHNRVMTIGRLRDRLAKLVPEARIEVAHGQMKSSELADVMSRFTAGEFDVLLCTTIIESGMDIPNANTILIDRADRFGIADLYQLRGRVGRSRHKAYAYLLLPFHGHIDSDARERIRAIRKHSGLSVGLNLAIRDMEIRGAGNILGAAQSGHISAVGFGLYCQLLKNSVARLKGEPPPIVVDTELRLDFINLAPESASSTRTAPAYIPYTYIEEESIRLAIYRRIAESTESIELSALKQEMQDRFGPLPAAVQRLLTVAEVRILAAIRGFQRVDVRNGKILLQRNGDYLTHGARLPTLNASNADESLESLRDCILKN